MTDAAEIDFRAPRPTLGYAPSTFLERGVVVPFTTPLLAGARVRPGERDRLELIVGNPSGARGVYILPWEGVFAICVPTVHDRLLNARVQGLRGVTPPAIRRLSLDAAQEGLAGRAAAAAAEAARLAEARLRTLTNFELLLMLVRQVSGAASPPADSATGGAAGGAALEAQARRAVARVAPGLRRTPEAVATMLEELAELFAPLGVGAGAARARVPAHISALLAMRAGIAAALGEQTPGGETRGGAATGNPDADLVMATADLTIACARATTADAMALLLDLPGLLRGWADAPDPIAARVARPDWLLDGWERICLLWQDDPAPRDSVFAELADLVPATPREAADWVSLPVESSAGALRHRRKVQRNEDWRTGASVQDLIARNEMLHARALEAAA